MAARNVHEGHRQRLRERAEQEGFDSFHPHQVLELLLFYSIPRQDTSEIAHELINKFGTVRKVLTAPAKELTHVRGIGTRSAEWLRCMGELIGSYAELRDEDRPRIRNCGDALAFCASRRGMASIPSTYHIALTPAGVVQVFEQICDSLQWGVPVALKKSLHSSLAVHARNVVVVEYVAAETPKVRTYDKRSAAAYAEVLRCMGAELLDVILVGEREALSLNQTGDFDRTLYGAARSRLSERYLLEEVEEAGDGDWLPVSDDGL